MSLDEAINFLKPLVKYSAVKDQKHIDPTLLSVKEMGNYIMAMATVKKSIQVGQITEDEAKAKIGV